MEAETGVGVQRHAAPVGLSLTRQDVINDYNTRPCQWRFWRGGGPPAVNYIILTTLFFSCGLSIEAMCDWHGDPLRLIGSLNCVTAREAEQTLSPL